jgi:predicted nuclease of restriction endonuclease-like RecB superfamily
MDSDHERKFARQVIYKIKNHQGWKLIKPLEGVVIEDTFLVPDFLIENSALNAHHLIEIMGMLSDPDYADRKEYIVPLMSKAWPHHKVVEIDPVSPSKDKRNYLEQLGRLCSD